MQRNLISAVALTLVVLVNTPSPAQQPQPGWKAVADRYYQRVSDCWYRYDRKQIKTFAKATDCADRDVVASLELAQYPYMDVVRWMAAQHAVIAERVDGHKITPAEGRAQWAEVEMRMGAELQRRAALRARAQADADAASRAAAAEAVRREALQRLEDRRAASAEAMRAAEIEADRQAALLRLGAGLLGPMHTGSFGESLGNGANSYLGVPAPSYPTQTFCQPNGPGFMCNSQ